LSNNFFDFFSYIPGVSLDGRWFLEQDSEIKRMASLFDVAKFVGQNYQIFFIGNIGITAMVLRVLLFIRGEPQLDEFFDVEGILGLGLFLGIFWIVPIIMAIYFVWAFVWEDAELKIAKTKVSTASKFRGDNEIIETTFLSSSSRSIQRIFGLFFGVPAIVWLIDKLNEEPNNATTSDPLTGFALTFVVIIFAIIAFFITGVAIIFMAVMYYRSGVHEELVNRFRKEIIEMNKNNDYSVTVGTFTLNPAFPPSKDQSD
jgi:uncharacterized membrane protein